jgi:hypothetical protein
VGSQTTFRRKFKKAMKRLMVSALTLIVGCRLIYHAGWVTAVGNLPRRSSLSYGDQGGLSRMLATSTISPWQWTFAKHVEGRSKEQLSLCEVKDHPWVGL